jgi:hypothetical protein
VLTVDFGLWHGSQYEVDYYIDKQTSYVRRVVHPGNLITEFDDYKSFEGIMMPTRIRNGSTKTGQTTILAAFAFNVEYDPAIFERKPSLEDGPDGWRRSK